MANVVFKNGTLAQYQAASKSDQVFYYITDTKELYLGEKNLTNASQTAAETSVTDTDGYYTGTDVEAVLAEIGAKLGNLKDLVVSGGVVEDIAANTVIDPSKDQSEGAVYLPAGTYIVLTIANAEAGQDKLYINVTSLIEYPTVDDTDTIDMEIDATHKITAALKTNSVDGTYITEDAIEAKHITDGAVGEDALADDSVTESKIVDGNVTEDKLSDEVKAKLGAITWESI